MQNSKFKSDSFTAFQAGPENKHQDEHFESSRDLQAGHVISAQESKTGAARVHSLEEIELSLVKDEKFHVDIVSILEKHHEYLKESIQVLMDKSAAPAEKQIQLSRFLHLMQMHGHAEEETLYQALLHTEVKGARLEGLGGKDEHDIAFQLGRELHEMGFEFRWNEHIDAKARVLGALVTHHIEEEETEMFPTAELFVDSREFTTLTDTYLSKCKSYLAKEIKAQRELNQRLCH